MVKLVLCLVIFDVIFKIMGVDRSNFKTCKDSGFCNRQRSYQPKDDGLYRIVERTVTNYKNRATALIKKDDNEVMWKIRIDKPTGYSMFRVRIVEVSPVHPRYELKFGDSIQDNYINEKIHFSEQSTSFTVMSLSQKEKAIVQLNPFKIIFLLNDVPILVMNERNLLNLEHSRNKEVPPPPQPSEGNETTSTDPAPATESNNGEWEETFKGHTDRKPFGPMSLGVDFTYPNFKHVYGIPEHADSFDLKDTTDTDPYRLYNLDVFEYELNNPMALYGSVPLLWGVNANHTAGIFWHNPSETWVDIKKSDQSGGLLNTLSKMWDSSSSNDAQPKFHTGSHWMSETGIFDVFVILANKPTDALKQYGKLTGVTPLPPMFSIAYHQCRWNYNDQEDVLTVDRNFDINNIPYDVIWLDIEHTDGKKYFTWDLAKFPNPDEMVDKLDKKGRKLVTVIDPHIKRDEGWDFFKDARNKELFVRQADGKSDYDGWCWPGSSSWLDFTQQHVRSYWAEKFLSYQAGNRPDNTFTWNDMGEPSVFNGPEVTMHKDAKHGSSEHRDVHNLYGMQVHRASWEGQLVRSKNQERPFVLTRAFFAGSQRYGAVWTGDNTAKWEHLKASIPMLLSISVTGINIVGADVGGFFGNPDAELFTRWYQAGAYQPFFRAHAHLDTARREPWLFPKESMEVMRDAIRQRYQLLPYWYTQFYLSEQDNRPVMAPLWYYFNEDENVYTIEDSYMIGPAILVRPVTDSGATSVTVYLPQGYWYSHLNWQLITGAKQHTLNVDIHSIPVFYRGGHIVPRRERLRINSWLTRADPYTLIIALDENNSASGNLYIDDGHTFNYKSKNEYALVEMHFENNRLTGRLNSNSSKTLPSPMNQLTVERIILANVKEKPAKVWFKHKNKQETQLLESIYMGKYKLLVIRKPNINLTEADWSIIIQSQTDAHEANHMPPSFDEL